MATAAASRRGRFPVGRRGAENGELFVDGAALAFRAGNFFPRRENNRLKAVLALAALVFEYRHGFHRGLKSNRQVFRRAVLLSFFVWRGAGYRAESAPAR